MVQNGNLESKKFPRGSQKGQPVKGQKTLNSFFDPFDDDEGSVGKLKRKRSGGLEEADRYQLVSHILALFTCLHISNT